MARDSEQDRQWSAWMAAAQAGDQAAYARLLRDVAPFLRIVVRGMRVPPDAIEDVLQDTLMAIHRVRHTYDPQLPFVPWLAAIARRRAIDQRRRQGRTWRWESAVSGMLETFIDPDANKARDNDELRQWLDEAVARLPPRQRQALEMVKLREMSVQEAAAASGQTQGAIKVNTHRAIRALRAVLERG